MGTKLTRSLTCDQFDLTIFLRIQRSKAAKLGGFLVSDSGPIFMLRPRSTNAYGQDFLDAHMSAERGFYTLRKENGLYPIQLVRDAKVIVGQNPDDAEESRVLNYLGRTNRTAIFVHCQWEYYTDRQRENVAQAMETAAIGITPARFSARKMQALFPGVRWKTVDGCVDTRFFYPSTRAEREAFRRGNGLAGNDKVVLFTGRLESAKGTKILRDLCATPRREFAIMVQYPASQNVRERRALFQSYLDIRRELSAFPKVAFFPDSDQRATPRPVRFADIFVSPSLSEVQPLVLLEALAAGVPYVGTNSTPGYAELQDRFRDSAALSRAIKTIDLPDYLHQGAIPRSTEIPDLDSGIVANELTEAINRKAVPDDNSRASLSREFLARGFTVPVRNLKFRKALEDASLEDTLL